MGNLVSSTDFNIYLSKKEEKEISLKFERFVKSDKKPIMILALGSEKNKTYPFEYLAQLIDFTFEITKAPLIFNYMPSQKKEIDKLFMMMKTNTRDAIIKRLTPYSLRDYMLTVSKCQAVIGNEGGAINIAKALSKPTFAIFSPIINPIGWHTEIKNKNVAIHLKDYFPKEINNIDKMKFKKVKQVSSLYLKLNPKLFKQKLLSFLKELK